MKNNIFSLKVKLLAAALVLVCGVALTGCKPNTSEPLPTGVTKLAADSNLIGTWKNVYSSGYELYTITKDTFTSGGDYGAGEYTGYIGDNLCVSAINEKSGYIYIKYTRAMNPDWTYSETAADVGKWYAIYYSNLSESSVEITGALGKTEGHKITSTQTLAEAVTEFTVENGYFASGSTCSKQ